MLFRDEIELIHTEKVDDGGGGYAETETFRKVFANKKAIRQTEFYQAHAAGLQPEIMFEIRFAEYNEERKLRYNGRRYLIIRTFSKNEEFIELVCQREAGAGG